MQQGVTLSKPDLTWENYDASVRCTSSARYTHVDHLGTVQMLTDGAGAVVWAADYEPFGEVTINPASTVTNNMRFPGQYYDQESGLHYNYFRTYDPNIGRYITSDPIGLFGGVNTYAYANSNPLNEIDPNGLKAGGALLCTALSLASNISDIKSVADALEQANAALDKIDKLKAEKSSCTDDVRKTEINKEISDLSFERSRLIAQSAAGGLKIAGPAVLAGVICGAVLPF